MKALFTCLLVLCFTTGASSQNLLANGSFEDWTDEGDFEDPTYWHTLNPLSAVGFSQTTIKTTDKNSGDFAVLLVSTEETAFNLPGLLVSGPVLDAQMNPDFSRVKIPFTSRPEAMSFYFKSMPAVNDSSSAYFALTKWNETEQRTDTVGEAGWTMKDSVNSYTLAMVNFHYYSSVVPDSAYIIFSSSYNGFDPTPGSTLYIDDFRLHYPTGLLNKHTASIDIKVYPNPAMDKVTISTTERDYEVSVTDLTGASVFNTSENNGDLKLNTISWKPGVYLLEVKNAKGVSHKKLIIN